MIAVFLSLFLRSKLNIIYFITKIIILIMIGFKYPNVLINYTD